MHSDDKDLSQDDSKDRPFFITGKALDRYFKLNDILFEFHKLFNYEEKNDRAIAIVSASFLDTLLEHILWEFLIDDEQEIIELLRHDQPLGTFSGKIKMIYCLGLIYEPVRDDLDYVRKIRNKFAHTFDASFEDQQIKDWCLNLKWHRISYMADYPSDASTQEIFQVGVNQLITYLGGVVSIARGEKRKVKRYK